MASSIARHTSTLSLISTVSLPREGNVFVQTLNRYREHLETACDKLLIKCCTEKNLNAPNRQAVQDVTPIRSSRVLEEKAREMLVQHLIELLSSFVLPEPTPRTIEDVDARLAEGQLCFPEQLMPTSGELIAFRALAEKSKRASAASLNLPIDKIFLALKDLAGNFKHSTCVYITAVTEKVISNFLMMAISYEERLEVENVIRAATIQNLFHVFHDRVKSRRQHIESLFKYNFPPDYNKCVKELVTFLSSSLEQMNLVLRIFREPVLSSFASVDLAFEKNVIQEVFGEALDIYNNFCLLLDYLESDCVEELPLVSSPFASFTAHHAPLESTVESTSTATTAGKNQRFVGHLLLDTADDIALASYSRSPDLFSRVWGLSECPDVTQSLARRSRDILHTVATAPDSQDLRLSCLHSLSCSGCQIWDQDEYSSATKNNAVVPPSPCNMVIACFRYLLPRLLLLPIFQFLYFHDLVDALYKRAYDPFDRTCLFHVLDTLRQVRLDLTNVLKQHSALFVQLARLVTTGHLFSMQTASAAFYHHTTPSRTTPRHRSYSASPASTTTEPNCRDSSVQRSSTPPPQLPPLLACSSVFCAAGSAAGNNFVSSSAATVTTYNATTLAATSEQYVESMLLVLMNADVCGLVTQAKLEELERLTGGKERFLNANAGSLLGNFVMEGRLLVKEEGKRTPSDCQAYLFTKYLLLCKRLERRSTLTPVAVTGPQPLLRLKRRLPLGAVHVIDYVSLIQPRADLCMQSDVHSGSSFSKLFASLSSSQRLHTTPEEFEHCSFSLKYFDTSQHPLLNAQEGSAIADSGGAGVATLNGVNVDEPSLPPSQGVQFHHIHFEAQSLEQKADWMASLLSVSSSRIYERYLHTLPKIEIPLRLPPPEKYRFAQPDTPDVIVFESSTISHSLQPVSVHRVPSSSSSAASSSSSTTTCGDGGGQEHPDAIPLPVDEFENEVEVIDLLPFVSSDAESLNSAVVDDDLLLPLPTSTSSRIHSPPLGVQITAVSSVTPKTSTHGVSPHRPQIQFATLDKLIERLTYPTYMDVAGVNAFLLTYRRFITPEELLDLLVERFKVPDPVFSKAECVTEGVVEHIMRRFRSGYNRRVQARVMTFLSLWVRSPRYFAHDFATNANLRNRLTSFLSTINLQCLLPAVRVIENCLTKADITPDCTTPILPGTLQPDCVNIGQKHPGPLTLSKSNNTTNNHLSPTPPLSPSPSFEFPPFQIDLLLIHPLELVQQVTLLEFDLYREIKFWEVDGRNRKAEESPNLSACKYFSNKFRNWLVYSILSERHPEDRVVAILRVIDLMLIFDHYRNLQGFQEARAALLSASVFRLTKTFQAAARVRAYKEVIDRLHSEPRVLTQKTTAKSSCTSSDSTTNTLRRSSFAVAAATPSPCVPYIAMGFITALIHLEVRHPDRVSSRTAGSLINFAKQRRLAEIIEGFLCHQRVPYTFQVDHKLQTALVSSLDAFAVDEHEFDDRMYDLSISYEPRKNSSEPPQFAHEDRRLGKEAIQAANFLAALQLKEKLLQERVEVYKGYFHPRQGRSGRISSPRLASPNAPPPSPPQQSLCASTSAEERVFALWKNLLQNRTDRFPDSSAANAAVRPLSSPSASTAGVVHHHSASDSLMENRNKGHEPHCSPPSSRDNYYHIPTPPPPPLSEGCVRRRPPPPPVSPPPPPPRRPSSAFPSSSPTSASHSPSPLYPPMLPLAPMTESADDGLPPLPPKIGQRIPTTLSSVSHSRLFFDVPSETVSLSPPPRPPRSFMSSR